FHVTGVQTCALPIYAGESNEFQPAGRIFVSSSWASASPACSPESTVSTRRADFCVFERNYSHIVCDGTWVSTRRADFCVFERDQHQRATCRHNSDVV